MKESDIRDLGMVEDFFLKERKWLKSFTGIEGRIKKDFIVNVPCSCCGAESYHHTLTRNYFDFVECEKCGTIFVNPRFTPQMIDEYYSTREERLNYQKILTSGENQKNRINMIFKPRKKMIDNYFRTNATPDRPKKLLDIGCASGQFLSTFKDRKIWALCGIEASGPLAEGARRLVKNATIINMPFEQVEINDDSFDVVTLWEVLEHIYDPFDFLAKIVRVMKKKGILVMSVPNIEGFDIQILWDKGNAFSAPSHLNYYRRSSVHILLERVGLTVRDISTPGLLDVDIVKNRIGNDVDVMRRLGTYWSDIFMRGDEESVSILEQFQDMIRKNNLSSHMVVIAEKQ